MSKANAREWQLEQRQASQRAESLSDQRELLRYAAEKRKCNYPSAQELRSLGFPEVADKLASAYSMIGEAYTLLRQQTAADD
jgi:hypothetical protein